MAADRQSIYITWLFAINGTDEVAQTGIHVAATSPATNVAPAFAAMDADLLEDLRQEMQTLLSASPTKFAGFGRLTGVKAALLATDGACVTEPKLLEDTTPYAGTQQQVVPQSTIVLSLRTGQTFGKANYGRMYLPYCHITQPDNSPFFENGNASLLAAAGADFVAGVNVLVETLAGVDLAAAIVSRVGSGTTKFVTQVAVDNLHDTQRRRARQLTSVYQSAPIA